MSRTLRRAVAAAAGAMALALAPAFVPAPAQAAEVNLYTTREPGLIQPLLDVFTKETGTRVNTIFLQAGLADRVQAEGRNSPADVLMTVDIGNLLDITRRGLAQPIQSAALDQAIPPQFRDPDGQWYALTLRARAIFVAKDRVTDLPRLYSDLDAPRFKGRVCIRSGNHPYNVSLFAAMLAKTGEPATETFLTGLKANLARKPAGGDREVARDILAGTCDVGLANTYYAGLMLSGRGGAEQKRWGEAVTVVLPAFRDGSGTHVNVSGAAVAKHAPNRAEAVKLLEFLVTPEAQGLLASLNFEYPVRPGVPVGPILASFGELRPDSTPLQAIADKRTEASMLVDQLGFDH